MMTSSYLDLLNTLSMTRLVACPSTGGGPIVHSVVKAVRRGCFGLALTTLGIVSAIGGNESCRAVHR